MASVQIKVERPGLARVGVLIALLFLAREAWGFSLGDDDVVSVSGCGAEGGSVAECAQNYLVDKAAGKLQDETISAGVDQLRKRGAKHLAEATETVRKKGVAGAFVDALGDVARKANNKTLGAAAKAARRALTAGSKAVPALNAAATGAEIGWAAGSAISENVVQPKMEAHYADQDRRFREEALSQTEFLKANKDVARTYSKRLRSNGPEAADLYLEAQMDRRGEPEYTLEEPSDGGSTSDESNVVADRHVDLRNSFDKLSDEETNYDSKMEEAPYIAKSEVASDGWRSTHRYMHRGRPPPSWGRGNGFRDGGGGAGGGQSGLPSFPGSGPGNGFRDGGAGAGPMSNISSSLKPGPGNESPDGGGGAGGGQSGQAAPLGWEVCGEIAAEAGARMLEACSDLLDNLDNLDDEALASCSDTAEAENRKLEMCSELLFDEVFDEDDVEAFRPAMEQCWNLPLDESVKCMESVVTSFRVR